LPGGKTLTIARFGIIDLFQNPADEVNDYVDFSPLYEDMSNPNLNLLTTLIRRKEEVMKNFYPYVLRSISRPILGVVILSLLAGLAAAVEPPPEFLTTWGSKGPGDGQFCYPRGIAVDGTGNIYVVDTDNHRIQKFDADGTFLTKWGSYGMGDGRFLYPYGIAVDSADDIYVSDMYNNRIQKFDADGTFLTKWGSKGPGEGQFLYPRGIAVDGSGDIYVADMYNHRIQKFDADGTFLTTWGSYGTGEGQFLCPYGVAVDGSGDIYVADTYNHRIQKFDADGTFLTTWGSNGKADSLFLSPYGVAVDGVGNVYVADTYNHRIQKFGNPFIEVDIDIRPWSCRNPLNMRSRGVLPVAILGSEDLDVRTIDVSTITLSLEGAEEGAAPTPIRSSYADLSGPLEGELCDRHELGPDGYEDLFLKFKTRAVARAIGAIGELNHGDEVVLIMRGSLKDGIQFEAEDSVKIIKKRCKRHWKWRRK
jgi:DNA-binding beta-propeller fold protein YncE